MPYNQRTHAPCREEWETAGTPDCGGVQVLVSFRLERLPSWEPKLESGEKLPERARDGDGQRNSKGMRGANWEQAVFLSQRKYRRTRARSRTHARACPRIQHSTPLLTCRCWPEETGCQLMPAAGRRTHLACPRGSQALPRSTVCACNTARRKSVSGDLPRASAEKTCTPAACVCRPPAGALTCTCLLRHCAGHWEILAAARCAHA